MKSQREATGDHMGIPAKFALKMKSRWEAMGGNMGIPARFALKMKSRREATGGHGNTARARHFDLKYLFYRNVRTLNRQAVWGNKRNKQKTMKRIRK